MRLLIAWLLLLLSSPGLADEYADTRTIFKNAGQSGNYFDDAYAYALFPTVGQGGFILGGGYGKGRVFRAEEWVGNTSITQGSIGFQFGGQAFSQIIFLQDERAFNEFTSGNFELAANASAVVITAAAQAGATTGGSQAGASGGKHDATTAGGYHKGMAIFVVAKGGAMIEVSVGGQKFAYTPR